MTGPRVKAMLIAPNEDFTAHAVSLLSPTGENPDGYHRLIGGGVELGETHEEAVRREVREELGAQIRDLRLLGVVESIFTMDGSPGHELVLLHSGTLDPAPPPDGGFLTEDDGSTSPVVWRSFDEEAEPLPLYPAAAVAYVHRLPRPVDRARQRDETIAAYDAHGGAYADAVAAIDPHLLAQVKQFAATVGSGARVLEVGSGGGRDALALESAGVGVDRTDISPGFVRLLGEQGHPARVLDPLEGDLGGPYAGVWANAVLLHLNRPEFAIVLRRLRDAVLPGGALFLSLKEGDGEGWSRHGSVAAPRHFTYWREPALREALTAAGWTVTSLTTNDGRKHGERWITVHARR